MGAVSFLQRYGVRKTVRRIFGSRVSRLNLYREAVLSKTGLEIGGPSEFFKSFLPVYECVGSLDNAVYSASTIWAENPPEYLFADGRAGKTFILDGTDLHSVSSGRYDFVLSCHSLEHIANPVKALKEWQRVTASGGYLILVVPDRRFTFDRKRPLTTVAHMIIDYELGIGETDGGHLSEVLALHDPSMDLDYGTREAFTDRMSRFRETRALHHHTFSPETVRELLLATDYNVLDVQTVEPFHIVALARK